MTNHTRFSQVSLAALLLAGLSAACMSDPTAGISLPDDAGQPSGGGTFGSATGGTTSATGGIGGTPITGAGAGAAETDFSVLVSPERMVDILFVVDNSPSMDPKQQALAANFPLMIQQLQQVPGGLPDIHIGVVSSDLGAGTDDLGQGCPRFLGDRGLLWGNDPNNPIASVAPGNTLYASTANITNGCGLNSGARWIVDVANANGIGRTQNYTGNLADVFTCLATAVGVSGCGFEHQLQATRLALNPQRLTDGTDINMANVGFVRNKAYLAIILITDEDDCSAPVADAGNYGPNNDNMFLQRLPDETASMRCAMRGSLCNGAPIPGYDPVNGYTPVNGIPFSTPLSNCTAREPASPQDSTYLPLIPVEDIIDSINSVSVSGVAIPKRPDQIFVSGIIGWPQNMDPSTVQFQIGKDATSIPVSQSTLWDYMPICTVPTQKSLDGNIYKAYAGLRLKKFLDAFARNDQNVFSICNPDSFTFAMTSIGSALVQVLKPACISFPLLDTDPNTPGIQPECQVVDEIACDTPGATTAQGLCLATGYAENSLPECMNGTDPLDPTNPQINNVPDSARPCWYLYYDGNPVTGCPDAPNYQRITALRKTGQTAPAGTLLSMKCLTCPASNPNCTAQ